MICTRLLLLLLLLLLLGSGRRSSTTRATRGRSGSTARRNRAQLGGTLSDELGRSQYAKVSSDRITHLVDVLARQLADQRLDARVIDLNTNGAEKLRDVGSRGGAVATDLEEEVRGDVTHLQERVPISFRQVFAYFASVLLIVYLAVSHKSLGSSGSVGDVVHTLDATRTF